MNRALYDPERGYYSARVRTVGQRGDFSTSATLSQALGCGIARWLVKQAKRTGITQVIEVGGGNGALMQQVRQELGLWRRLRWRFSMVETSPTLTGQQKAKVGRNAAAWFTDLPSALAACKGRALIFHNELLDAFPVDLVQWDQQAQKWRYVLVEQEGSRMVEHLGGPADDPAYTLLHTAPERPGLRAELHSSVRSWLQDWLPVWQKGCMLTIDYGATLPEVYIRRPRGTLRSYLMQQRVDDIYANPGRQDITCDINFTDIRQWLTELGCREVSYQTQADFLAQQEVPADAMADPQGAGAAFQCLAVER
jgi:SAM-dependent MidA family methyltransferase